MNDKDKLEALIMVIKDFDKINKKHLIVYPNNDYVKGQKAILELLKAYI